MIQFDEKTTNAIKLMSEEAYDKFSAFVGFVETLPGGTLVVNYIRASHKNDPWRTLLEIILALIAVRYFFSPKYSHEDVDKLHLTDKQVEEAIERWEPVPLVHDLTEMEKWQLSCIPQVDGPVAAHSDIVIPTTGEIKKNVLNFASKDFLNMSMNEKVQEDSIQTVRDVGVGACGPPNFYGTQDVHVRATEDLARFLGSEKSMLYGQDFCTATSVLPCFLKRGDIVIVDGGVSIALQKAAVLARCSIEWFNHNDLDHLEEILESLKDDFSSPNIRRFILTEGLFENFGDSPDLARLVALKNKFKYRLILDESNSIGVLGANGRGLAEVYNIPREEIEVTMGTLAKAFGSSGGFCLGCDEMIYHQILSSAAYVFSAALPPYCAKAVSTVISLLEQNENAKGSNKIIKPLHDNLALLNKLFKQDRKLSHLVEVKSAEYSPIIHLRIHPSLRSKLGLFESYGGAGSDVKKAVKYGEEHRFDDPRYESENYLLQSVIDEGLKDGVYISRSKRILHHELLPCVPELIINVSAAFTENELRHTHKVISSAIVDKLSRVTKAEVDQLVLSMDHVY